MNARFEHMLELKRNVYVMKYLLMKFNGFLKGFIYLINIVLLTCTCSLILYVILESMGLDFISQSEDCNQNAIKVLAAVLTLCVASVQCSRHIDQNVIESILNLRDAFDRDKIKEIQQYLIQNNKIEAYDFNDIEIYNFLGYLEVGSLMLQRGMMNKREFSNQFGYTLQQVLSCEDLYRHIKMSECFYEDFLFVVKVFHSSNCRLV